MIPGPARILTCPHCDGKKEVLSLKSGNTFGAITWSDNKTEAHMLPRISFVQQCPHCGEYYLLSRQDGDEYSSNYSFNLGELDFVGHVKAWEQLSQLPDLTESERMNCRFLQVWAYNDEFTRKPNSNAPSESDVKFFMNAVDDLINSNKVQSLIKAELLRETGRFDEAATMLDSETVDQEFLKQIIEEIRTHITARDTRPFVITDR